MLVFHILDNKYHIMGQVRVEYEVLGVIIDYRIIYERTEDKTELEYQVSGYRQNVIDILRLPSKLFHCHLGK